MQPTDPQVRSVFVFLDTKAARRIEREAGSRQQGLVGRKGVGIDEGSRSSSSLLDLALSPRLALAGGASLQGLLVRWSRCSARTRRAYSSSTYDPARGPMPKSLKLVHRWTRGRQRRVGAGRPRVLCVPQIPAGLAIRRDRHVPGRSDELSLAGLRLLDPRDPVRLGHCRSGCPRGTIVAVSIAPIVAAMALGRPSRGRMGGAHRDDRAAGAPRARSWYGTLANHAGIVLPAIVGGSVRAISR